MNDIVIYGFGGFGREIASIIENINRDAPTWNIIGFIDDGIAAGTENKYGKVLGNRDFLNDMKQTVGVVMAIASPVVLSRVIPFIDRPGIWFPNVVAPDVLFFDEDTFVQGRGNVLCHGCRISCDVKMGDFNLLNGMVSLGHDVCLGSFNVMQPETRISGEAAIGDRNFFGVRSLVLQGIKIGNETRIGTGSVVMRKTKDGMTYFGNPAKILRASD